MQQADDYVKTCVICQRNVDNKTDYVELLKQYLKLDHLCKRISSNTLTVTSPDDNGRVWMDVIVNLFPQSLQLHSHMA